MAEEVLIVNNSEILVQGADNETVTIEVSNIEIVETNGQGPPGRDADTVTNALRVDNKLNEYAGDPVVQEEVQSNIGLGSVDPLAYYILAKA